MITIERTSPDRLVVRASYPYESALCAAMMALAGWYFSTGQDLAVWKRWALGLGVILCGAVLAQIAEWSTFVIDRKTRTCRWTRRGWYGVRAGECSLDSIEGVVVEAMASDQYRKQMHRLVLKTLDGPVPIGKPFEQEAKEKISEVGRSILSFLRERA